MEHKVYCKSCKYYISKLGAYQGGCLYYSTNPYNGIIDYKGKLEDNLSGECPNFKLLENAK